tara:strand:+ start:228 stop:920 length:693 start_codon:yes stop_codon:yes gene_type:complete
MEFSKFNYNGLVEYFKLSNTTELSQLQFLEPMSIIINLAILSFQEENTKIAITNNNMFIQRPSFYQGVVRYLYGNNREDICFLLKPIMRALEMYDPSDDEKLEYIFNKACIGLSKLKNSYNNTSSTVCHSLDLYISIISAHLNGTPITVESYQESRQADDLNLSVATQVNIQKIFLNIWSESDIELLYSMFKTAEQTSEISMTYIKSITNLVKSKKPEINKRIKKTKNFL